MTVEYQKFLPQGFTQHPTTVLEALRQGKAVLTDEQNWMKGELFVNDHPEVDPDNAFCNSWHACSLGALAMVTIGARREVVEEEGEIVYQNEWTVDESHSVQEDTDLYMDAMHILESVLPSHEIAYEDWADDEPVIEEVQWGTVWEFNDADNTTHQQVMDAFDRAIAKAEEKEAASV